MSRWFMRGMMAASSFVEEAAGLPIWRILLVPAGSGQSKAGSRTHEQMIDEGDDDCSSFCGEAAGVAIWWVQAVTEGGRQAADRMSKWLMRGMMTAAAFMRKQQGKRLN
jgi:hypothetical protein